jgi:hypothetical protein
MRDAMTKEAKEAGVGKSVRATTTRAKTSAAGCGARVSKIETPIAKSETGREITPEERWKMIAEAAYYHAEKRGFAGGDSAEDWMAAESEIDAKLAKKRS